MIDFNEIGIEDKGAEELGNILNNSLGFLEILQLDGNKISGEGFSKLNFSNQKRLKVLSLSNNQIDEKGLKVFETINYKSLERLLIGNNKIKAKGLEKIINEIVKVPNNENTIKELNISDNQIDEILYETFTGTLNHQRITEWDFMKNETKCLGIITIFENLCRMKNLRMINFSSNVISNLYNKIRWLYPIFNL
jgi:hypothetical protein